MYTFVVFILNLINKLKNDDLFALANELAYKVLLAFFPFIIFLMALLGFLKLDDSNTLERLYNVLPPDINRLIMGFLSEVYDTRSKGLLSTSLVFSLYNTNNGFRAMMRCINKAYGFKDNRNIFIQSLLAFLLMLIFASSIVIMLVMLIFGNNLLSLIQDMTAMPNQIETVYYWFSTIASLVVLAFATMLIFKLSCANKVSMTDVLPGATVTVLLWVVSSYVFSYFINTFSRYSTLYGSIAGVFILIMWLNLISIFLLLGNEINSLLTVE